MFKMFSSKSRLTLSFIYVTFAVSAFILACRYDNTLLVAPSLKTIIKVPFQKSLHPSSPNHSDALTIIRQKNLFAQEKPSFINNIKKSTLKLKLNGIIHNPEEKLSIAIIENNGQSTQYVISDTIRSKGGRVTLHKIEKQKVIINHNGNLETLSLFSQDPDVLNKSLKMAPPPATNNTLKSFLQGIK